MLKDEMLGRVIHPVTEEEFFRDYWTRTFLHVPGPPDRFRHFYTWEALNQALEQQRLDPARLKMVKQDRRLPSDRYLGPDKVVNAAGLTRELADGATLVFELCEEAYPPLRDFCIALERQLHAPVYANLYAAFKSDFGYPVHWDPHEIIVVQVEGRKHWKVWAPTRINPVQEDRKLPDKQEPGDAPPVWEGVLEAGSMLYLPRGWWHVAFPLDESSLHITVTIEPADGLRFLRWFIARRLGQIESVRATLPLPGTPEGRRAYLRQIKEVIDRNWTEDLLDDFLTNMDAVERTRPSLNLPHGARPRRALAPDAEVSLVLLRPLSFTTQGDRKILRANNAEWTITPEFADRLLTLNDFQTHALASVVPAGSPACLVLLLAMAEAGVVRIGNPPASAAARLFGDND